MVKFVKFVTDVFSEDEANVIVLGVDCPASLREVSRLVEPFDIIKQKNLLANARTFDAGEVELSEVTRRVKVIIEKQKFPLILGGKHTLTLHAVKALPAGTKLIVFDAHADLKDEYLGEKISYATWLRRACEIIEPKDVVLLGVRSCDEDEFEFMKSSGLLHFTSNQIRQSINLVKQKLQGFAASPTYVSIDMDVFDPSIAPAVENPEPAGILYRDFVELIEAIRGKKIVGMDVVEVEPIPKNKVTEFLAVKVIFEILSRIKI